MGPATRRLSRWCYTGIGIRMTLLSTAAFPLSALRVICRAVRNPSSGDPSQSSLLSLPSQLDGQALPNVILRIMRYLGGRFFESSFLATSVATSCRLSLHAYNRSIFAREIAIDSRAYVISQHSRWLIRTPRPTCANQDVWVVSTPKRPKSDSIHTAPCHA